MLHLPERSDSPSESPSDPPRPMSKVRDVVAAAKNRVSAYRGKNWCFTSYDNSKPHFNEVMTTYYCFARERGSTTSRLHWQGFVVFDSRMRLSTIKSTLSRSWHFEGARGSVEDNIKYVRKNGGVFEEHGSIPRKSSVCGGSGQGRRWLDIRNMAARGHFGSIPSNVYLRHSRNIHSIHERERHAEHVPSLKAGSLCGLWIAGPPGVGKSHRASELAEAFGGLYRKSHNKWWDGYASEPVIVLDDLDTSHAHLASHLKIWADRYAFVAEVKGSSLKIRPKQIIITSNYTPQQIWPNDLQLLAAIERRFVVHCVSSRQELVAVTLNPTEFEVPAKPEVIYISSDSSSDASSPDSAVGLAVGAVAAAAKPGKCAAAAGSAAAAAVAAATGVAPREEDEGCVDAALVVRSRQGTEGEADAGTGTGSDDVRAADGNPRQRSSRVRRRLVLSKAPLK